MAKRIAYVVALMAVAAGLSAQPYDNSQTYGKGTYNNRAGTYEPGTAKESVRPASLLDGLVGSADYDPDLAGIPPVFADTSTVWYFSPSVDTTGAFEGMIGTGTKADPFPALSVCATYNGRGGDYYISQYASADYAVVHEGSVDAGDVIALMRGDHGDVALSQYYFPGWVCVTGMRGAYISSIAVTGFRRLAFDGVEFRNARSLFADPGHTETTFGDSTDVWYGLLDDFNTVLGTGTVPTIARFNLISTTTPSYGLIIYDCKFGTGEDWFNYTQEQWIRQTCRAINLGRVDSTLIEGNTVRGIKEFLNMAGQGYTSIINNDVRGLCGDGINAKTNGGEGRTTTNNVTIRGNSFVDFYRVDLDHVDGIAYYADSDSGGTDITIDGNLIAFASTTERAYTDVIYSEGEPSQHWVCTSDDSVSVNEGLYYVNMQFLTALEGDPHFVGVNITNNTIYGSTTGGIAVGVGCNDCSIVNNTLVPIWLYTEVPAGMYQQADAPSAYFNPDDATYTFTDCVVANNASTSYYYTGTEGVTHASNYTYTTQNSANAAGFTSFTLGSPQTFSLTPYIDSPLIDAANATYAPTTDKNGAARPLGIYDDIGAIESPNWKLTVDMTLAIADSSGGYPVAALSGYIAADATLYYQFRTSGETFTGATEYTQAVADGYFEDEFQQITDLPIELFSASGDSILVRGRLYRDSQYGPYDYPDGVLYARAPADTTPPTPVLASVHYDELGTGDTVRLLASAVANEDAQFRYAFATPADTTKTWSAWTPSEGYTTAGDSLSLVMETGDAAVPSDEWPLYLKVRDAAGNVSAIADTSVTIAAAAGGDTTIYVFADSGSYTMPGPKRVKVARGTSYADTTYFRGSVAYEKVTPIGSAVINCNSQTAFEGGSTYCTGVLTAGPAFAGGDTDDFILIDFGDVAGKIATGDVLDAKLYLHFNTAGLDAGSHFNVIAVTAAGLYEWNGSDAGCNYNDYDTGGTDWTTALSTYADYAAFGTTTDFTGTAYAGGVLHEFDITAGVAAWEGSPANSGIIMLTGSGSADSFSPYTEESATRAQRWMLVVKVVN